MIEKVHGVVNMIYVSETNYDSTIGYNIFDKTYFLVEENKTLSSFEIKKLILKSELLSLEDFIKILENKLGLSLCSSVKLIEKLLNS